MNHRHYSCQQFIINSIFLWPLSHWLKLEGQWQSPHWKYCVIRHAQLPGYNIYGGKPKASLLTSLTIMDVILIAKNRREHALCSCTTFDLHYIHQNHSFFPKTKEQHFWVNYAFKAMMLPSFAFACFVKPCGGLITDLHRFQKLFDH